MGEHTGMAVDAHAPRALGGSRAVIRRSAALRRLLAAVALWASVIGVIVDVALLALAWRFGTRTRRGGTA